MWSYGQSLKVDYTINGLDDPPVTLPRGPTPYSYREGSETADPDNSDGDGDDDTDAAYDSAGAAEATSPPLVLPPPPKVYKEAVALPPGTTAVPGDYSTASTAAADPATT